MKLASVARLALLPTVLLGSKALAADLGSPPPPYVVLPLAYDWSGLHIGLTGGGAFNGNDPSFSFENVDAASVAILPHGGRSEQQGWTGRR
jgi:hypothetical protein